MKREKEILQAGIDVGSTTTKIVVLDPYSRKVLYSDYQRHHADQVKSVSDALLKNAENFQEPSAAGADRIWSQASFGGTGNVLHTGGRSQFCGTVREVREGGDGDRAGRPGCQDHLLP